MTATGWPVKDVTQLIYDSLEPVSRADPSLGWPLLAYVDTIGGMFQEVADIVEDGPDGEPGWSILLDVNRCPDAGLPWLAQFIGLHFYIGLDASTERQQIRDHVNWQRGTPASIIAAVRLFLTGTRTVQLSERDLDAYHFDVTIWAAEAPSDTSTLIRYVNTFAKPAGLQWTLTVDAGTPPPLTYLDIWNAGWDYLYMYNSFQTYNDIHK